MPRQRLRAAVIGQHCLFWQERTYPLLKWSEKFEALRTPKNICMLYALLRLSNNNLDDPRRTRVKSLIRKAIEFRDGVMPPKPKPLTLPLLAHDEFSHRVSDWLRDMCPNSNLRWCHSIYPLAKWWLAVFDQLPNFSTIISVGNRNYSGIRRRCVLAKRL